MYKLHSSLLQPSDSVANGCKVLACRNLRPTQTAEGFALEAVPLPAVVFTDGWLPFAEVPLGNSEIATVCRLGNRLALLADGLVVSEITLDGEPMCCLPSLRKLVVMTAASSYVLNIGTNSISGAKTQALPPPRFYVENYAGLSAEIGAIGLSKEYALSSEMASADVRSVSAALNTLYKNLDANARAEGVWWQPVVACTIMRDSTGNVLGVSPPVLLTHPDGKTFAGSVKLQSTDLRTTHAATIDAPAWKVKLCLPANASETYADVCTIDVVATPALHSVDVSGLCSVSLRRRADADYFCIAQCASSPVACSAASVEALVARAESVCSTILSISKTQISSVEVFNIPNFGVGNPSDDLSRLVSALKKPLVRTEFHKNLLGAPHSFTARRCVNLGAATLWGGLAVIPFNGFGVENFAIDRGTGSWRAYAEVKFADGSSVVASSEGSDGAPVLFNPVLSYPSPDAITIRLVVENGGKILGGSFPLAPDASGVRAVYVSASASPFALTENLASFTIPQGNPPIYDLSDYLAAAPSAAPLSVTACSQIPGAEIIALLPAKAGQSAWDFGRTRFYAMTDCGIFSICLSAGAKSVSQSLIDSRTIASPEAVVCAGNEVYACACGEILRIKGSNVKSYATIKDCAALAWDALRRELWCVPSGGSVVEVICTDFGAQRYTVDLLLDAGRTVSLNSGSYLASASEVRRLGTDEPFALRFVEWAAEKSFGKVIGGTVDFSADLVGSVEDFGIALRRIHLNRVLSADDMRISLSGIVGSPLRKAVFLPPCERLRCIVAGSVKKDFVFSSVLWK